MSQHTKAVRNVLKLSMKELMECLNIHITPKTRFEQLIYEHKEHDLTKKEVTIIWSEDL